MNFERDLIPEPKPGGRPREVDMWEVLNGIFYVLVEGVRWRAFCGDFPPWQTVYTYFRNWRKNRTWLKIHDSRREWTLTIAGAPTESIGGDYRLSLREKKCRDGESMGFDAGKKIKGRKRFLTVDTLGKAIAGFGYGCQCGRTSRGQTSSQTGQTVSTAGISFDNSLGGWGQ